MSGPRQRTRVCTRRGFSLLSAIFLLVVIALAGAFMVRVAGVQRATTTFALLGPKAYHAARSGLEWTAYQALNAPGSCPSGVTTVNSFALSEGGLTGFAVRVSCESDVHVEGASSENRFHITAEAEWRSFGDRDYVSRRLETTISDAS